MRILSEEEKSQAVSSAISDWAMSGYKEGWGDDAMAQDNYNVLCKAQAELTRAETLKEVGEWIKALQLSYAGKPVEMYVILDTELGALLRGELEEK
ncbi:MAG: hypothetical protein KAS32_05080 [Candidatus Peribacteraceae bacterium]|nr:hypothetical protein [Candidatus Peribacteraceae bacterium]